MLKKLYQNFVLKYPKSIFLLLIVGVFSFGYYATKLEIDASSETLLLDNDPSLKLTEKMNERYGSSSMLIITYAPNTPLLSDESLETLKNISQELEELELVKSVDSILTLPLLLSPPQAISELVGNVKTLSNGSPDKKLVQNEFLTNPLYKGNLVSEDFKTTAILLNLVEDKKHNELKSKKKKLEALENPTEQEKLALSKITADFKQHRDTQRVLDQQNITEIRTIMENYKSEASLFLGGVNMIANDIVGYVKSDLLIYGSTLVILLLLVLWFVFRELKWVLIPLVISVLSVLAITSSLGYFGWEITVISSNFIALQLIITLSIVLHLIVHYNEMLHRYPHAKNEKLILTTILHKANPTFFAIVTTIAGFSSLVVSNIKPVINLGWMMSAGIALSLLIAFIVFPTLLLIIPKSKVKKATKDVSKKESNAFIQQTLKMVLKDKKAIFITTVLILLFSMTGATKLIVENSFINYFKEDTAIYQGMKVIDEELGGTTPLDIIVTFKEEEVSVEEEEDEFGDEFAESANDAQYWFTEEKMNQIMTVHDYLESIPEIGTVQSLASILKLGTQLNNNKPLDGLSLGLLYTHLPEKYKGLILSPYVNVENNQVRFATRIVDSNKELRRDELLKKIEADLNEIVHPKVADSQLSNLMVLYNNMLQSLFDSQISTLGFVLAIIFVMFLLLFRSLKLALIAIAVNIVPIGMIFGVMGWFAIPLDIMTITIAAIAIGIGVDDTIHYVHRYEKEYHHNHNYELSAKICANTIGNAMLYTSLTIMIGFSILILSNLIPTIYFGILTMLVMGAALIANLMLLPRVLILVKPFRKVSIDALTK
ncbi:MAG TPA: RND family transporter [Campylobacterales bacterium]|nr:RND family transporter [Campylobacterales bacterium]